MKMGGLKGGGKFGFLKDKRVQLAAAGAGVLGLVVFLKRGNSASAGTDPNQTGSTGPSTYDSSSMDSYSALSQLGQGITDALQGYSGQLTDIQTQLGAINGPGSGTNTTTPPTTTPVTKPAVGAPGPLRGRVTTASKNSIWTTFTGAANAVKYYVTLNGKSYKYVPGSGFTIGGLKSNTRYTVGIQAVNANGSLGPVSNTVIKTK